MAREPALNLPNPWAAVGRDTEAGRALFALYNGYGHARTRGNDYSQINKIKTLKHIATHGLPEFPVLQPPPPKKPEVKVPHFPHKHYDPDEFHPIDFIPRRRRASEILQQIRDDSYVVELPPMPKGPLLDEAEKARLQEVFYWSNRNLGPEPPEAEPLRRLPKKGSIAEQELLLNTIAKEIEDREAFLTEMEAYGKGEQYRSQIMFEIQQRVGQMKLLHKNITQQEKKENENQNSVVKTEKTTPQVANYTAPPKNLYARGQGRNANTTTQRFNPFIASIPEVDEDPRFLERSSNFTRQQAASSNTNRWKARIDTPASARPNVIATAACYATTPGDTSRSMPESQAMAESQAATSPPSSRCPSKTSKYTNSNLNLNLDLDFPRNDRRRSTGGSTAGHSAGSPSGSHPRPPSQNSFGTDAGSQIIIQFQCKYHCTYVV